MAMTQESIDYEQIATILGSPPSDEPVVSLYVGTAGGRVVERNLALKELLKEGERSIKGDVSLDERQQKQALLALESLRTAAKDAVAKQARGTFVGFAWSDRLESFHVPITLDEHVEVGRAPHTLPLVTALEESERLAVVLVDARRGRVIERRLGEMRELADVVDPTEQDIAWAGWLGYDQLRMSHRREYALHRHAQHVADWLFAEHKKEPFDRLILGGNADVVAKVGRYLHPSLAPRVAARERLGPDTPPNELRARLDAIVEEIEAGKEQALLASVREHLGSDGLATTGPDATLRALADGKVATLLLAAGKSMPGHACPSCRLLFIAPKVAAACPRCDTLASASPDVVEAAVDLALATGARVRRIARAAPELEALGGMASILRFL
jgi:hypothetical protein